MIKLKELIHTCTACPAQWQGITTDGKHVYIRERWDNLSAGVGDTLREAVSHNNIYYAHIPNIGFLDYGTMQEYLAEYIDFSEVDYIPFEEYVKRNFGYEDSFSTHSEDAP